VYKSKNCGSMRMIFLQPTPKPEKETLYEKKKHQSKMVKKPEVRVKALMKQDGNKTCADCGGRV